MTELSVPYLEVESVEVVVWVEVGLEPNLVWLILISALNCSSSLLDESHSTPEDVEGISLTMPRCHIPRHLVKACLDVLIVLIVHGKSLRHRSIHACAHQAAEVNALLLACGARSLDASGPGL